jgi:hypothetical protein
MNINNYLKISKIFVLFFIFATGCCDKHHHDNISLFNNNICKTNNYVPYKKKIRYYACKHRVVSKTRRAYNPYGVFTPDILRKYIYIVNVVIIYIILYSL